MKSKTHKFLIRILCKIKKEISNCQEKKVLGIVLDQKLNFEGHTISL